MGWLELIGTPSDGILHRSDCTYLDLLFIMSIFIILKTFIRPCGNTCVTVFAKSSGSRVSTIKVKSFMLKFDLLMAHIEEITSGRKVTLLVWVQYFKVAPSIYETSLNLVFNFSPNFMWAHGLLNTLAHGYQSN